MLRLLHTADWQIAKEFGEFEPDEAALLAEARLQAIRTIAALAREHGADAILCAGDCFDTNAVRERTIRQVFAAMGEFAGPWVMIPGNHDAALAESVWTIAARLGAVPANVYVCLRPEPLDLLDGRLTVLPAPLTQRHTVGDLTGWFDGARTPPDALRVGLAHGGVPDLLPPDADIRNPITRDRADRAGLDYLALGDWHGTLKVNDRTYYSGTPETDRFRDNASGQTLLVELERDQPPRVTPLRTGRYRWTTHEPLISVPTDVDTAVSALDALTENDVVNFRPTGQITLAQNRLLCDAVGRAQGRVRALRFHQDRLRLMPTGEDISALRADGYVARVIDTLRSQQANGAQPEEAAVAREALVLLANMLDTRGPAGAATCD